MIAIYLLYGLAFFTLGLAALLESRRKSVLLLGRQLPWLAAFGLTHSVVEWTELLALVTPVYPPLLTGLHVVVLPLSALLLLRFGLGLISESGPLPRWLLLFPVVFITPAALVAAYVLIVFLTEPNLATASDIWSRYLLFIPGGLLAAAGFWRQSRDMPLVRSRKVKRMMDGAAAAFAAYAVLAGLIVPPAPYGLAPWLNYDLVQEVTGAPIQIWRTVAALAVTVFVVRALDIFDFERKQHLETQTRRREEAEETLRASERRFRRVFEYAPIGMDIVSAEGQPVKANHALQQMLGYSEGELRTMVFADYTHPDDVEKSLRMAAEVREGKRESFQMEKRYYRKDGQMVFAKVTVSAIRDGQGGFSHYVAMVEDITEQKQTAEALEYERERAQEARLRVESEARRVAEEWVNALVEIGRRVANMEGADSVLIHIVKQAQHLLQTDIASLALFDERGECLNLKYQATAAGARVFDTEIRLANDELITALRTGRSRRFPEDAVMEEVTWHCPTVAEVVKAAAVVPLHFDGQVVGGLWAARSRPVSFTPTQLFGLENLADQAVIALQHASMAAQLQTVATLEERSRIAREMHDGLAQILGYLGIQMQTIEAYLRQGKEEAVLAEIDKTRENVRLAQADVRENILSLRTTLAGSTGLAPALQEYVQEFGIQTKTEARFVNALSDRPRLSPLAEVQLVRIVQEALTNVRKHARAQQVEVRLFSEEKGVALTIADDGIGFEVNGDDRRFGLQTMAERAQSVGGRLDVCTGLREGTEIRLWLPLQQE